MDCFQIKNAKLCSFCKINPSKITEGPVFKKIKTNPELDLAPNLALYGRIDDFLIKEPHLLEQNALLINQKKTTINEIAIFIEKSFPVDAIVNCLYCDFKGYVQEKHVLLNCPFTLKKCFCCMKEGHLRKDCQLKNIKFKDIHYECGLPYSNVSKCSFHQGNFCTTSAKDNLIPYLMLLYETDPQMISEKSGRSFDGQATFFKWIHLRELGITNGMRIFYNLKTLKSECYESIS
jgi:hypothetical protein